MVVTSFAVFDRWFVLQGWMQLCLSQLCVPEGCCGLFVVLITIKEGRNENYRYKTLKIAYVSVISEVFILHRC